MRTSRVGEVSNRTLTFDDLGTPLVDTTFVVVDLETTGGSPKDCEITEIGAVKTTGGVVAGEFGTLVNPGVPIPPFIAALTGITTTAVMDAPRLASALPAFLDFAAGSVLVAHNAGFDIGFLKAACRKLDYAWPNFPVVDTARLARVLLNDDEVPNKKLASLARYFKSTTEPNHRALSDARATVDVLHGLLERAGGFGAHHLDDLAQLTGRVTPQQRQKRTLADGLPERAGVYVFWDRSHKPLYVGKSKSIRNRVRSYFTESEKRKRITEMVRIADEVTAIPCATDLEAQVREVRLIAEYQPPYNRRSKRPEKSAYLKLTTEAFPRLSITSAAPTLEKNRSGHVIGPFPNRSAAQAAKAAIETAFAIRTCTLKLTKSKPTNACIAAELGSCLAPCDNAAQWPAYGQVVADLAAVFTTNPGPLFERLVAQMQTLAAAEKFEAAATLRDQLHRALTGIARAADFRFLQSTPLIIAASPGRPTWDLHVIKYGRLAGASPLDPQIPIQPQLEIAADCAASVAAPTKGTAAAVPEEATLILKWLRQPGVRLAQLDGQLMSPISAPERYLAKLPTINRLTYPPRADPDRSRTPTPTPRHRIRSHAR